MNHVVIGTAGHIDHGKTTLIKAMTGRDTDTLKEEKERGISINLGFTYFDLPSGRRAGIVDVPGHERFIKNMLAGVSGIDAVILVIAADEGVMPQTREHMNILSLLDVKKGIVAVTKKDMVDDEWLEVVLEDIREYLKGSFLENADIIPVSSVTGEGIDELVKHIDQLTEDVQDKNTDSFFRLPVDRVFTISGFGTVVTGTLIAGTISEGDKVMVYPKKIESKVRSIQVHEQPVKSAFAGQRVAINLSNVSVEDIKRGDVAARPGSMEPSMMIDCRLNYLKDAARPLENRDRVRIYHGTSELLGRVVILDKEELAPGETALVQIRLENPISAAGGDKYVIRSYSPMVTIGGGTVIDSNPPKRKRFDMKTIRELQIREKGNPDEVIEQVLLKNSRFFPTYSAISKLSGRNESEVKKAIDKMTASNTAVCFSTSDGMCCCHHKFIDEIEDKLRAYLEQYHKKNTLKAGASKEEIKSRLFEGNVRQKIFDDFLALMEQNGIVRICGKYVALYNYNIKLSPLQERIKQKLLDIYNPSSVDLPKPEEVITSIKENTAETKAVFEFLLETGEIIKINEDMALSKAAYDSSVVALKDYINKNGSITLAQYRDLIGTSRKVAVQLLEHFDQIKLTRRMEDKRVFY